MIEISATKKLNYLDDAISFMKSLLSSGRKESARSIKKRLLEVCRLGIESGDLIPAGQTKNMFQMHISSTPSDGPNHPGYRITMIIMEKHVLVTTIQTEYC